ncbi:MAG TPA: hypothetical protein VKT80_07065 [Chloroflexota bacterium]|nr:hypothetical protein [Chloroflexota bacterium]
MICEEFRDRWDDRDRQASDVLDHRSGCDACVAWAQRQNSFDDIMLATMVVGPPPELANRLARIPAAVFEASPAGATAVGASGPAPYNLALEAVMITLIAVAAIGFGGFDPVASFGVALAHLGNFLQAIPLIVGSPLLPYLQTITVTAVEALATLVLLAVTVTRTGPENAAQRATEQALR